MKTISEHITHIKGQPHHVRKRIAYATATFGAVLVAIVWLAISIGTGAFAVQGSWFADIRGGGSVEATVGGNDTQNLAGAAAAFSDPNAPARIEIVDTASSTKTAKKAEQTTIPF